MYQQVDLGSLKISQIRFFVQQPSFNFFFPIYVFSAVLKFQLFLLLFVCPQHPLLLKDCHSVFFVLNIIPFFAENLENVCKVVFLFEQIDHYIYLSFMLTVFESDDKNFLLKESEINTLL